MISRKAYIEEVRKKCEVFKQSAFWPGEPIIRPNAWLDNFGTEDSKYLACRILDNFVFLNNELSNILLSESFKSIPDSLRNMDPDKSISQILGKVVFTAVSGEEPNPTDSGYLLCRKARQILGIPDSAFETPEKALELAQEGCTVIFCDDFIGSGDQFLKSWTREYTINGSTRTSFKNVYDRKPFQPVYMGLISTRGGIKNVHDITPQVCVCVSHIIDENHSISAIGKDLNEQREIDEFLIEQSKYLQPLEKYMHKPEWKAFGYKKYGLLLGFEHSIPDATLPIFWSPGSPPNWVPLITRS